VAEGSKAPLGPGKSPSEPGCYASLLAVSPHSDEGTQGGGGGSWLVGTSKAAASLPVPATIQSNQQTRPSSQVPFLSLFFIYFLFCFSEGKGFFSVR
jgi:hypothetical protein